MAPTQNLCSLTVIPLSRGSVFVSLILNFSQRPSVSLAHTHALCLSPAPICLHFLWVPVMSFLFFSVAHPKSKRNCQPLLPTLLQGMFCPRPARMVPSITHGLILAPLPLAEMGSHPTSQGESSSPQGCLPGALSSCQPALGFDLCAPQAPGVGGGGGRSCPRGKREEGEGPPSLIS